MAASLRDMADDSSSSDDEALKRCQEAVWDCQLIKTKGENDKPTKRFVVADHKHDGNELEVTQGFQTHVAKKLGAMLDSFISENQPSAQPRVNEETTDNKDDEDEGFRLFSTSVPGSKPEEPPAPKRRPIPSSSDSDSEMERLKEAAVSISDILKSSATAFPTSSTAPETLSVETQENVKKKKKKKKKKKLDPEENGKQDSQLSKTSQCNIISQNKDQILTYKKKKKRKKAALENSDV